jgi:hypothetical protein
MIFACNKYVNKPGEGSDQAMQIVLDHIKNDIPSNEISSDVGTYIQQGDNTLESFDMETKKIPHVYNDPDMKVVYESKKNHWAFHVARLDKDLYLLRYYKPYGESTTLTIKVNIKTKKITPNFAL